MHCSGHKTQLLVWSLALDFENMLPPPYSSYIGYQYSIALFSNYVSLYTKTHDKQAPSYLSDKVRPLPQMPTCDPLPDSVLAVPRKTGHQGHVLSLAREVFSLQDQLHRTLCHITFMIPPFLIDTLNLFLFRTAFLNSL